MSKKYVENFDNMMQQIQEWLADWKQAESKHITIIALDDYEASEIKFSLGKTFKVGSPSEQVTDNSIIAVTSVRHVLSFEWPIVIVATYRSHPLKRRLFLAASRAIVKLFVVKFRKYYDVPEHPRTERQNKRVWQFGNLLKSAMASLRETYHPKWNELHRYLISVPSSIDELFQNVHPDSRLAHQRVFRMLQNNNMLDGGGILLANVLLSKIIISLIKASTLDKDAFDIRQGLKDLLGMCFFKITQRALLVSNWSKIIAKLLEAKLTLLHGIRLRLLKHRTAAGRQLD